MSLHAVPLCFRCHRAVEGDKVYAAACDHEDCPSSVFHPICLMEWREHRDQATKELTKWAKEHNVTEIETTTGFRAMVDPDQPIPPPPPGFHPGRPI